MGPFTAKLEVTAVDEAGIYDARIVEVYPTKHRPASNGLGQCIHCGRPVHLVQFEQLKSRYGPLGYYRHNPIPRLRVIPDRKRTNCSKCDKPGQWYEFKPGSGECAECQT